MSRDLRHFLHLAREAGSNYYVEVNKPLKSKFEVCVLQQKLARKGRYPVLYCPKIEGSKLPLVTNLFGSYEMLGLILDLSPERIQESGLIEVFREYRKRLNDVKPPSMIPASESPIKEIILRGEDVDLSLLPIIHHAEGDAGKYVTIGFTICKDPDTGVLNTGVYRHEVKGKNQLALQVAPAHHGGQIAMRYAELGKPMEVVICIGHHPAVVLGSMAEGSLDMNEFEVMGALLGESLEMTAAETVDLPVPAHAEIVIEGVIDASKMITDGPFAEYTHYYGGVQPAYLINVTGITMREDAIYHDLDPAHQEHNLAMVLGSESIVYDAVKRVVPGVQAVHVPPSGTCYYHTYVSIKKRVEGEGKLAGLAALTGMFPTKLAVVVDDDIDIYNEQEVLWAIATRIVGDEDISIISRVTGELLDPLAYDETRLKRGHMMSKVIIDATKPTGLPFPTRITPPKDLWASMKLDDYLQGDVSVLASR